MLEGDTVLALARAEMRSGYDPVTYGGGGVRRGKRRRERGTRTGGEVDGEHEGEQDERVDPPYTQPPPTTRVRLPRHPPRELQRAADARYMGRIERLCVLRIDADAPGPGSHGPRVRAEAHVGEGPLLAFVMGENGQALSGSCVSGRLWRIADAAPRQISPGGGACGDAVC